MDQSTNEVGAHAGCSLISKTRCLRIVDKYRQAIKGSGAEFAPKVAKLYGQLAGAGISDEREADKEFVSFLAKLKRDEPFEPAAKKKAEACAVKYKGTKSGARFERYLLASRAEIPAPHK